MEGLMSKRISTVFIMAVMLAVMIPAEVPFAEEQGYIGYTPTQENLEARAWFQDAKFGLFVHWGVYSLLGKNRNG